MIIYLEIFPTQKNIGSNRKRQRETATELTSYPLYKDWIKSRIGKTEGISRVEKTLTFEILLKRTLKMKICCESYIFCH